MAALTFLKHWRPHAPAANLTSLIPSPSPSSSDDSLPADDDSDDDGPFFDLSFSPPKGSVPHEETNTARAPQALHVSLLRVLTMGGGKRSKSPPADSEERRFSREVVMRYLSKIKVKTRGARRSVPPVPEGTSPAVVRVVCRRLGKSRSASSVAGSRRRDESLVVIHEEDGIESAIAHCKRSFNGSTDPMGPQLERARSDICEEKLNVDLDDDE